MKNSLLRIAALCVSTGLLASGFPLPAQAQEAATSFAGGSGENTSDQFPGTEGDGWAGPWKIEHNRATRVVTSTEGAPANPWLKIQASVESGAQEYNNAAVVRSYENADETHVIRFKIRPDRAEGCEVGSDFIGVFGGASAASNFVTSSSWAVRSLGKDPSVWKWAAYHGEVNGGLFDGKLMREIGGSGKGMRIEMGETYEVTITNHPKDGTYDVSISHDGNVVEATGLLYRSTASDWSPQEAWIGFQAQTDQSGGLIAFSVTDISISPAP